MLDHGLRLHRCREGLHQVILAIATVESSSKAQLVAALSLARDPGGAPGDTGQRAMETRLARDPRSEPEDLEQQGMETSDGWREGEP